MKKKNSIIFTGGSRIGPVNETFPFSRLIVEPQKLILKTTFSGTLEISSRDLLAVKEVTYFPILAQGIKIEHQNSNYKATLIFWSFKDPYTILKVLEENGLVSAVEQPKTVSGNLKSSNSIHSKRIKFITSPLFIAFIAAMLLFLGFLVHKAYHRYDDYNTMEKVSEYQLKVKKTSIDHGVAFLNDSIIVPAGTSLLSEKPEWFRHKNKPLFGNKNPMPPSFADLEAPFDVIKNQNSFKFKVVKYSDTLVFQIPDPDFKDPRDLTFGDIFEQLFRN